MLTTLAIASIIMLSQTYGQSAPSMADLVAEQHAAAQNADVVPTSTTTDPRITHVQLLGGGAVADLRPPLSNVEWYELASERTEIDVDEVREHVNSGLQALEDMNMASQELDADGVANGLTDLSNAAYEIEYALSYLGPSSDITVTGSETEELELSEYITSLEAQRPPDPLRPDNVTRLNINQINQKTGDVAFATGYMLAVLGNPGGIVSDRFYQQIQDAANALFDIHDALNFGVPLEEVTVTGRIADIPASRQEALQKDATTTDIFI